MLCRVTKTTRAVLCTKNRHVIRLMKLCRTENFNWNPARQVQNSLSLLLLEDLFAIEGKLQIQESQNTIQQVYLGLFQKPCTAQFLIPRVSYLGAVLRSLICKSHNEKTTDMFGLLSYDQLFNPASDFAIMLHNFVFLY